MSHAFYIERMSWKQLECTFRLCNNLRWPADGLSVFYPSQGGLIAIHQITRYSLESLVGLGGKSEPVTCRRVRAATGASFDYATARPMNYRTIKLRQVQLVMHLIN